MSGFASSSPFLGFGIPQPVCVGEHSICKELLNQVPCTNFVHHTVEGDISRLGGSTYVAKWPLQAGACFYRPHHNSFEFYPFRSVSLDIKPFFHPLAWPLRLVGQHRKPQIFAIGKAVVPEVVVQLVGRPSLHLVMQFVHFAEGFGINTCTLASQGPYKNTELYYDIWC